MQEGALRYQYASTNIQLSLALEFGNSCVEKIEVYMLHIFLQEVSICFEALWLTIQWAISTAH